MISLTIGDVDSSSEREQQPSGVSTDKKFERRLNFAFTLIVIVIFGVGAYRIYSLSKSIRIPAYHVEVVSNKTTTDNPESQADNENGPVPLPCDTEQCESNLTESIRCAMNSEVDPCKDFYQFACGNWKSSSGANSRLIQLRERTLQKLMDLTEQINETDTEALRQLKVIYDSCVNFSYEVGMVPTDWSSSWELANPLEWRALKWEMLLTIGFFTNPGSSTRRQKCIQLLEDKLMPFAIAHKYLLDNVRMETVDDAKEMYNNIVASLQTRISSLEWMDHATKQLAIEKVTNLKVHIGYPDWVQNPHAVDECYQGLNFTNGTLIGNVLTLKSWEWESKKYKNRECLVNPVWNKYGYKSPVGLGAHFQHDSYTIVIPAGLKQQPLFGNGLRAADYGALGMIIGHELVHGLLFTETEASAHSNYSRALIPQWNSDAKAEFEKISGCVQNQYNSYWSTDLGADLNNITRKTALTSGEDFADAIGLRLAYQAYKLHMDRRGKPEPRLPGLEQYTPEQVFFLSFANVWCTTDRPTMSELDSGDVHSPYTYRVIGSLSNSPEFSEAWKCSETSRMNPKIKCGL